VLPVTFRRTNFAVSILFVCLVVSIEALKNESDASLPQNICALPRTASAYQDPDPVLIILRALIEAMCVILGCDDAAYQKGGVVTNGGAWMEIEAQMANQVILLRVHGVLPDLSHSERIAGIAAAREGAVYLQEHPGIIMQDVQEKYVEMLETLPLLLE